MVQYSYILADPPYRCQLWLTQVVIVLSHRRSQDALYGYINLHVCTYRPVGMEKKKKRLLYPLQAGQQRNQLRMWAWVPVSATTQVRAKIPRHDLCSDMRILRLGI